MIQHPNFQRKKWSVEPTPMIVLSYSKEHPFGCSFIFNWTTEHSPSRRTASPNGSDWESEAYGLIVTINTPSCFPITQGYFSIRVPYSSISVPYSARKKVFSAFYPPFLPFSLGTPLFTGVRRREGKQISLPSRVPCFQNGREWTKKREGNGRDNHSPSRASNALYIGIWEGWREEGRVKSQFFISESIFRYFRSI